jgi:hypothetical protein
MPAVIIAAVSADRHPPETFAAYCPSPFPTLQTQLTVSGLAAFAQLNVAPVHSGVAGS